jgi:hypothetical protein
LVEIDGEGCRMRDLGEYLRAYRAYISANVGWWKALIVILTWLSGIFAPLGISTFVFDLPNWIAFTWMVGWSSLGYVFAPYGMWRYHRAQVGGEAPVEKKTLACQSN